MEFIGKGEKKKLIKIGGSLVLFIPHHFVKIMGLKKGDTVVVRLTKANNKLCLIIFKEEATNMNKSNNY